MIIKITVRFLFRAHCSLGRDMTERAVRSGPAAYSFLFKPSAHGWPIVEYVLAIQMFEKPLGPILQGVQAIVVRLQR